MMHGPVFVGDGQRRARALGRRLCGSPRGAGMSRSVAEIRAFARTRTARRLDAGDFDGVADLSVTAFFESPRGTNLVGADAVRSQYEPVVVYDDGTPRTKHVLGTVVSRSTTTPARRRHGVRSLCSRRQTAPRSSRCSVAATTTGSSGSTARGAGASGSCTPTSKAISGATCGRAPDRSPRMIDVDRDDRRTRPSSPAERRPGPVQARPRWLRSPARSRSGSRRCAEQFVAALDCRRRQPPPS